MSLRIKTWLIAVTVIGLLPLGCAKGPSGTESDMSPALPRDGGDGEDAGEDAGDEREAGLDEDAGMDGGREVDDAGEEDAGTQEDAGEDAGEEDAGLSDAALDASEDTGVAEEAGPPDAGNADAGRPPPAPLPTGTKYGTWTYVEVPGAKCRDGSPAGYYHRRGNDNLMIFLNGTGACADDFFCQLIPKNVGESMTNERLGDSTLNLVFGSPDPTRQTPPDEGILKRDDRNPVGNWSMIFVPYCTGDVFGGAKPDGTVPGAPNAGTNQFVGYTNMGLFYESFGPSFSDSQRVLLAGSGAGGFGALLNLDRTQKYFSPQGAEVMIITDSGIPFRDPYLEPCLQKKWRDTWNLDAILPSDCEGCRNADGGGLASGLGTYLFKDKYPDMLGGFVTSNQDQVVKVFFSAGLENCTVKPGDEALAQVLGPFLGGPTKYPSDRYPTGIRDVVNNVVGADKLAYYVITSGNVASYHMHLFRSRYYDKVAGDQTIADWVGDVIAGKRTHVGNL